MPHSLRCKLKCLRYKKIITDREYERLCKALDNENNIGEWIECRYLSQIGVRLYKCSECGEVSQAYNYCHHCGNKKKIKVVEE